MSQARDKNLDIPVLREVLLFGKVSGQLALWTLLQLWWKLNRSHDSLTFVAIEDITEV